MRPWMIAAVMVTGFQIAVAQAQIPDSYSCKDPPISHLRFSPDFLKLVASFFASNDPADRETIAKRAAGWADSPAEKARAKYIKALSLLDGHNTADAESILTSLLGNDYVSRDTAASIRLVLANLALKRDDYDGVLRWLEPIDAAACPETPVAVRKLLAFVYQERKRYGDTLRQADLVHLQGDSPDVQRWRAIGINLGCQLEGPAACMQRIGELARWGNLAGESLEMAQSHVERLRQIADAQDAVAQAKATGLIDADGKVVVSQVVQVEPIKAVQPRYPVRALGVNGYVDVRLVIHPDGSVKSAEVVEARPPGYFESAALAAARASTFKPRIVNGQAVESRGIRRYNFQME
jgi:TonB family protein